MSAASTHYRHQTDAYAKIASTPQYSLLRQRGYSDCDILELLARQQQVQPHAPAAHTSPHHTNAHGAPRTLPTAHVACPPPPSIDDTTMFRYNHATQDRRTDSIPLRYQRAPYDVAPRVRAPIQRRPVKSHMEDAYQSVYTMRQADVPLSRIPVGTSCDSGSRRSLPRGAATLSPPTPTTPSSTIATTPPPPSFTPPSYTTHPSAASSSSHRSSPHSSRRQAFEAELHRHHNAETDAYALLGVSRDFDLKTLAKHYRRAALKYHPDRIHKHAQHLSIAQRSELEGMFEKVTRAYLLLMDKHSQAEANRPFYELREHSREALAQQGKQKGHEAPAHPSSHVASSKASAKAATRLRVGEGKQFDRRLFNTIYDEHRLYAPHDEGYGDWLSGKTSSASEDVDDTPPTLFSSKFNLNVFNTTFDQLKREKPGAEAQLAIRDEMGVVVHSAQTPYSTLGAGAVDNYSGTTASLQYSDLKSAHTSHATLIDPSRVHTDKPTFRSIKEFEAHRASISHELSPEEAARAERAAVARDREERERRARLVVMDQQGAAQERRLNQLLLR